jgi:stringent starvation protein B
MAATTSTKPYLIRAIYEWCGDNGLTPYIAVAVDERTRVPREYVKAGEIVLNVSAQATQHLTMGNELIEFHARFGGVARELSIPVDAVSAIYARETGHGMAFDVPKAPAVEPTAAPTPEPTAAEPPAAEAPAAAPIPLRPVRSPAPAAPPADPGGEPTEPSPDGGGARGRRPRLTRVK